MNKDEQIKEYNKKSLDKLQNDPVKEEVITQPTTSEKITDKAEKTSKKVQEEKELQQKEELQEEENATLLDKTGKQLDKAKQTLQVTSAPVLAKVSSFPTPQGIALLLFLLLIMVMAIIPVNKNGDTRLKLLWLTLSGKTTVSYGESIPQITQQVFPTITPDTQQNQNTQIELPSDFSLFDMFPMN